MINGFKSVKCTLDQNTFCIKISSEEFRSEENLNEAHLQKITSITVKIWQTYNDNLLSDHGKKHTNLLHVKSCID